jgi:hypothetical protein
MEAPPSPAFKVVEANLPLEFLIVALNTPTEHGEVHEFLERRCGWAIGEPELGGLFLVERPLVQQPDGVTGRFAR